MKYFGYAIKYLPSNLKSLELYFSENYLGENLENMKSLAYVI